MTSTDYPLSQNPAYQSDGPEPEKKVYEIEITDIGNRRNPIKGICVLYFYQEGRNCSLTCYYYHIPINVIADGERQEFSQAVLDNIKDQFHEDTGYILTGTTEADQVFDIWKREKMWKERKGNKT